MLIRTELVGREPELDALTALLDEALDRRPHVVLCEGEPGIGKTRLAEELLTRAAVRGVASAWGSGLDSEGVPPYWPWRQALRALAVSVDLGPLAREHGLSPDAAGVAPDLFSALDGRGNRPAGVEDRLRQFDAIARLIRLAAMETPLVIVLDDAHWADVPSLLLLQHVARGLTDERLLLVVNSRDTKLQARPLLAELQRERRPRSGARLLDGRAESGAGLHPGNVGHRSRAGHQLHPVRVGGGREGRRRQRGRASASVTLRSADVYEVVRDV